MNARGLSSGLLTGPSGFTIGFDACRRRHVWPTDVEGAELDRVFHADPEKPDTALLVGDVLRLRCADYRLGFMRAGGAQCDSICQVWLQFVDANTAGLQRLGSQQQMDPQRPPDAADPVEQPDEVRVTLQQLGELVDDDEKRWQRG